MWFVGYMNMSQKFIVLFLSIVYKGCEAITNADFNAQIRDYSVLPDNLNLTEVKTLQKQGLGLGRYASYAPVQNPVKFTDVPDSVLSGSNHARGLLHHDHTGFGYDYEDPHYGQGYDFQHHGDHQDPHDYHHYDFHSPGHHHGYGYHHKHYDHGLVTKTLLWPIAGIALLGAAAALVSNPVLLQLGVVSGKRRRRQIEDMENIAKDSITKWSHTPGFIKEHSEDKVLQNIVKKRLIRKDVSKGKDNLFQSDPVIASKRYSEEDPRFIPIPLKLKNY